jgi:hypothetical protein
MPMIEDYSPLTDFDPDAIGEIPNIVMARAANSLRQMIEHEVPLSGSRGRHSDSRGRSRDHRQAQQFHPGGDPPGFQRLHVRTGAFDLAGGQRLELVRGSPADAAASTQTLRLRDSSYLL